MKAGRLWMLTAMIAGMAAVAAPGLAERGDDSERASKNGKTAGTIDGVEVEIEFGRPNVKGRELWGSLVPYDKVWRAGADEATTITFSQDVLVEGERLSAGKYGLFSVPGEAQWEVIFNKVAKQWGAFRYDAGEDALRVKVEPESAEHVESLDYRIDGSQVVLRWGEIAVSFTVHDASD